MSRINPLGRELFELIQADQGFAHISDAVEVAATADEVLLVATVSLRHTEACARKLRAFIAAHATGGRR